MRSRIVILTFSLSLLILISFLNSGTVKLSHRRDALMSKWIHCMSSQMDPLRGNINKTWESFPAIVNACHPIFEEKLELTGIKNNDETKYHIYPKDDTASSTIVTLGIGNDTKAEKQLKDRMQHKAELFGADPTVEDNEKIFSQIGSYFPFAVGAKPGMSVATVLAEGDYKEKTVVHIDLVYFLKRVLERSFLYSIWLDAEYAEYDLFPLFRREAELDKSDVTICQLNIEAHNPNNDQRRKAHEFFFHTIEDQRYVILRSATISINHIRLYMVNLDNEECIRRFGYKN